MSHEPSVANFRASDVLPEVTACRKLDMRACGTGPSNWKVDLVLRASLMCDSELRPSVRPDDDYVDPAGSYHHPLLFYSGDIPSKL